jgi:hypothetical protein
VLPDLLPDRRNMRLMGADRQRAWRLDASRAAELNGVAVKSAEVLGIDVSTAGPLRTGLIRRDMTFSPQYGDTAFTVPMFDDFMKVSVRRTPSLTVSAAGAT